MMLIQSILAFAALTSLGIAAPGTVQDQAVLQGQEPTEPVEPFVPLVGTVIPPEAAIQVSTKSETPKQEELPPLFRLKTRVLKPDLLHQSSSNKGDLYVGGYHTGAGLGDVVLVKRGMIAYLNDTEVIFEPFHQRPEITWSLSLDWRNDYDRWTPVSLNAATWPTSGFEFDKEGKLVMEDDSLWGGWIVCDWAHNYPQLFWVRRYRQATTLPTTCDYVDLIKEDA